MLLLLALALGAAACGSASPDTTAGGVTTTGGSATTATADSGGEPAPDVSGVTLDGTKVSLSEYRGKPLVLAFMASW
ncbi:MAG: redoxin domain-containing protein [Lentisphaerae bacterium]|nr:redoxin domain-containing protein [Lentisphaerota bacterium]